MGGLEEQIAGILNDPKQMQEISALARSLMGASEPAQSAAGETGGEAALLSRIAPILSSTGESEALLAAMRPYLSEKRRGKLNRALQVAKLARIAKLALEEKGGDGGAEPL